MIDWTVVAITFGVMAALLVLYFLARLIRMYHLNKRAKARVDFYGQYEPPKGQAAIDSRKEFEDLIAADPDYAGLNRAQRRALAKQAERTMNNRAKVAKRLKAGEASA